MTNATAGGRLGPAAIAVLTLCVLALSGCGDTTGPDPVPALPTPVAAVPASDQRVTLSWGLQTLDVTEVRVERASADSVFSLVATLTGAATTFADSGLLPATLYRYRLQACNTAGCSGFTDPVAVSTFAKLAINPVAPPPEVVGDSVASIVLLTTGGNGAVTFAIVAGAPPPGVALSPAGVISGTPTGTGTFNITVGATSADGQTATLSLTLVVRAQLVITTTALPNAVRGLPYNAGLNATGADSAYTWFVDAGSLPAGLSLSNTGIISGTPATEQLARFTARVRSGDGQTAVGEFTITVIAPVTGPALSIRSSILPPGLAGMPYSPALATTGGSGSQVTWTVVGGSLPPGIALETGGIFTGIPTTPGIYSFTVQAASSGQSDQRTFTIRVVPDDLTRFNITRVDVAAVSSAISTHVQAAIARWESAIRGDLGHEEIPRGFFSPTFCGGFGDVANGTWTDDVIIMVNIASIDGRGKILGQAAPCGISDNALTVVGTLTLDADDLQPLVGTETLTDIIFHEMGHILGFGTLWSAGPIALVTGEGTTDPRFTGAAAMAEWRALGGMGTVPLENTGGSGTADAHWREATFRTEVMTGFVSAVGTPNPLSRLTIAAMADLGYAVDYGAAEAYTLPSGPALRTVPTEPLGWDVIDPNPIVMLMPDGTARLIPR